jgi:23S rRNA (pseudouridine1915-N3)-methyltransferase
VIRLNILAVGKLKEKYWKDALEEYVKRIRKYAAMAIAEVADEPDEGCRNAGRQQELEGERLLKQIKGFCVLLDLEGKSVTSEEIAAMIQNCASAGESELTFVIGGSRGVSQAVKARADRMVSLGSVTFPHQLMRVILAEQLYRAMSILNNTGYHK